MSFRLVGKVRNRKKEIWEVLWNDRTKYVQVRRGWSTKELNMKVESEAKAMNVAEEFVRNNT